MQDTKQKHYLHPPRDLTDFPVYAQKYPSLVRYHLSDVKKGIDYPNPPSLRNIDRDEVLHKLSDEHCRHTTLCRPECFKESLYNEEFPKTVKRDYCIDKLLRKYSLNPVCLKNKHCEILKVCPPERKHFEEMCSHHKGISYCIRYDPCEMRKQEDITCLNSYLCAPWN